MVDFFQKTSYDPAEEFETSAAELVHLSGSRAGTMEENLKTYTSLVMDEYARQFDRELNGRPMPITGISKEK